jgi:hypothetical protein
LGVEPGAEGRFELGMSGCAIKEFDGFAGVIQRDVAARRGLVAEVSRDEFHQGAAREGAVRVRLSHANRRVLKNQGRAPADGRSVAALVQELEFAAKRLQKVGFRGRHGKNFLSLSIAAKAKNARTRITN